MNRVKRKVGGCAFSNAFNKARCEEVLFRAHGVSELTVTSIRPGHTYGAGDNKQIHSQHSSNYYLDRIIEAWRATGDRLAKEFAQ